jgi:hypothetical protein
MAQPTGISIHPETGNVGIGVVNASSKLQVNGHITPSSCNVFDLGSSQLRFRDIYLSGSTIDLGGTKISRDENGGGITLASASGETVDSRVKNLFADGTITASNLNIVGDYVTMRTTTSNTEMMVIENAGTGPALKVTQTGANSIAEFYDDGGVLALKIADGGNVGIGVTNPMSRLVVSGASSFQGNTTIGNDSVANQHSLQGYMYHTYNGSETALVVNQKGTGKILELQDFSVPILTILDGGNVGIGTTVPLAKLNIYNGTNANSSGQPSDTFLTTIYQADNAPSKGGLFVKNNWANDSTAVVEFGNDFVGGPYASYYRLSGLGTHIFGGGSTVARTENMRITASGNVGIGTTTPIQKLDVSGGVNILGALFQNGIKCMMIKNIFEEYDTADYGYNSSWALGRIWTLRNYNANSKLMVYLYVPFRNNSSSWGGLFTQLDYNINNTGWVSMGNNGYYMMLSGADILIYSNWFYLPLTIASNFSCQFRCQHRTYDGTANINSDSSIGGGTANSYGINVNQHFYKLLVVEIGG